MAPSDPRAEVKRERLGELARAIADERLPCAIVDLDAFDRNVAEVARLARAAGKPVRLATKSVRSVELLARALRESGGAFRGLMCFSAEEARFLWREGRKARSDAGATPAAGFDDFLVAYPTVQPSDLACLRELHEAGASVSIVVDDAEQVRALARAMAGATRPFAVLLDIDMSLRFWGGRAHLGVRRSRLRTVAQALEIANEIARTGGALECAGLMAYEAQVAGLTDRNPFKRWFNPIAGWVRRASLAYVARLRAQVATALRARGVSLRVVNGAGTGSLNWALAEPSLTEVTVGSALLSPHLFDYYSNIRFEPACYFALQAVRASDPGYVTCAGGGYIASGSPGWDRLPVPVFPMGSRLSPDEGCGEVQTPLRVGGGADSGTIALGAPVLFRHAKAGELAERFMEYALVSGGAIVGRAPTYRGLGQCFF